MAMGSPSSSAAGQSQSSEPSWSHFWCSASSNGQRSPIMPGWLRQPPISLRFSG